MHLHLVFGGRLAAIAFFNDFVLQAGLGGLYAVTLAVFSQERFTGGLVLLGQFLDLLLLLGLHVLLVCHQGFLDFLAAQALGIFIAGVEIGRASCRERV